MAIENKNETNYPEKGNIREGREKRNKNFTKHMLSNKVEVNASKRPIACEFHCFLLHLQILYKTFSTIIKPMQSIRAFIYVTHRSQTLKEKINHVAHRT